MGLEEFPFFSIAVESLTEFSHTKQRIEFTIRFRDKLFHHSSIVGRTSYTILRVGI